MAVYAIGDIQGCYLALRQLLKKIDFNPKKDTLWVCGDLVNRGPDSLKTLQYLRSLGSAAQCVLGNHDLHLLALYYTSAKPKKSDTLDDVLNSPDVDELMEWLRQQPLFHYDVTLNCAMVHAGIYPGWSIEDSLQYAKEVQDVLRGAHALDFFNAMYGNKPSYWNDDLKGIDRLRFITNVFTRMRYVDEFNHLKLKHKGEPSKHVDDKAYPWFELSTKNIKHNRVVFGHWSTLESKQYDNVFALDSGCLWGGSLTALKISSKKEKWIRYSCS